MSCFSFCDSGSARHLPRLDTCRANGNFTRGLCLPSDNKMTPFQQDLVIDIIHRCFL